MKLRNELPCSPSGLIQHRVACLGILAAMLVGISLAFPQAELAAQVETESFQYLPAELKVEKSEVQSPAEFLGYEIGERHIRHHESVAYFRYLATASDRVTIETYAKSHGNRPLVAATITSKENQANIEQILEAHRKLVDPDSSADLDTEKMPAVIYMGYSVHGDESSGGNAAPIIGYMLAASSSEEVQKILQDVVVIVDPCFNPDGFDRFAAWANSKRGKVLNGDPAHAEHNQPYPGGRVNYYWFDLNRDWLPLQHPESQGRANMMRKFRPNVVLDFHEMGANSTFFFQPGIPQRKNPLTPNRNVELTKLLGNFHAKALDEIKSIYFTEEQFDDFYMGKGSTYPDLHGAIGILFEQASSRGHLQESVNGPLAFPFTIRNQVRTSISSLRGTLSLKKSLLNYQRDFYKTAKLLGQDEKTKYHLFTAKDDPARMQEFGRILMAHNIRAYRVNSPRRINGSIILPNTSLLVPTDQPEFLFLKSLLERRTDFEENIFYDISTWVLPLAFNLKHAELTSAVDNLSPYFGPTSLPARTLTNAALDDQKIFDSASAFAIDWRDQRSGRLLYQLLDAGARAKVARQDFTVTLAKPATGSTKRDFSAGSIIIPVGIQDANNKAKIAQLIGKATQEGIAISPVGTGLTPRGIDIGSGQFRIVKKPSVMLLAGDGVSRYTAGTLWHMVDTHLQIPMTHVEPDRVANVDLSRYTTILMPPGSYRQISDRGLEKLKQWLANGGTLVAIGSSISWLNGKGLVSDSLIKGKVAEEDDWADMHNHVKKKVLQKPFASAQNDRALELISGAIFQAKIDRTHPVCYGYTTDTLPIFRNSSLMLNPSKNVYSNPVLYSDSPLLSGYVSKKNLEKLRNTVSVTTTSSGRGTIVLMVDEPNFRAFWYGTSRLLTNSIYFGDMMGGGRRGEDAHEHGHSHGH